MTQLTLNSFSTIGGVCPTCGDQFDSEWGMKIHHSKAHGESIEGWEVVCEHCSSLFKIKPNWAGERRFCSDECQNDWQREAFVGEGSPTWNGGPPSFPCTWCGDEFETYDTHDSYTNRFCSRECHDEWRSENQVGEAHHQYASRVELACEQCGDSYQVTPHKEATSRFCSDGCLSDWQSENWVGDEHHNWRGGKSVYDAVKKLLPGVPWQAARERAYDRADEQCEKCGAAREGARIDIHHIVPILCGGTNNLENLMALCVSCHSKTELYMQHNIPEIEPVLTEQVDSP